MLGRPFWKLKLKIEKTNWKKKLKMKIENENYKLKLKKKMENENWKWKIENSKWIFRCWGDHWVAATGEEMDLNPHIPKPEPPPEPEKVEEKKEEEKKEGEEKKEEQATTEKEEKKEEEKEKADEKKEADEKKVIRTSFKAPSRQCLWFMIHTVIFRKWYSKTF